MWQMYYYLLKKDNESKMDPELVKELDEFYANERNKLN